jgi:beta-N-acetylhexosaminidase
MSESKRMILGASGLSLTQDEIAFYRDERPWGFILFARNVGEVAQLRDLATAMRDSVGRPDAPVFIDQEGGRVQRLRPPLAPNYPPAAALGELYRRDREAGLRAAWLMSRLHAFDLVRCGVDTDCLPVLDVPVEGAHDVIGQRAYARDPEIVAALGRAAADGLFAGGVLPVMKHIPGHGRAGADTHFELPTVNASLEDLREHDFAPFRALRDLPMAMTAHVVYSAIDPANPATHSARVIEEIIRGEIGFDGRRFLGISTRRRLQSLPPDAIWSFTATASWRKCVRWLAPPVRSPASRLSGPKGRLRRGGSRTQR